MIKTREVMIYLKKWYRKIILTHDIFNSFRGWPTTESKPWDSKRVNMSAARVNKQCPAWKVWPHVPGGWLGGAVAEWSAYRLKSERGTSLPISLCRTSALTPFVPSSAEGKCLLSLVSVCASGKWTVTFSLRTRVYGCANEWECIWRRGVLFWPNGPPWNMWIVDWISLSNPNPLWGL